VKGAVLVCGTHFDAGKSVLTAGDLPLAAASGVSVAPFKAEEHDAQLGGGARRR